MLAFSGCRLELEKAGLAVLAHLVGDAAFHGSEDANHSFAPPALVQQVFNNSFFALPGVDLDDFDALIRRRLTDVCGDC